MGKILLVSKWSKRTQSPNGRVVLEFDVWWSLKKDLEMHRECQWLHENWMKIGWKPWRLTVTKIIKVKCLVFVCVRFCWVVRHSWWLELRVRLSWRKGGHRVFHKPVRLLPAWSGVTQVVHTWSLITQPYFRRFARVTPPKGGMTLRWHLVLRTLLCTL